MKRTRELHILAVAVCLVIMPDLPGRSLRTEVSEAVAFRPPGMELLTFGALARHPFGASS